MLILSRRVGERIIIGDSIEVVVQSVSGERVTLGLAAPRDVKILRAELEDFRNSPAPQTVPGGVERINGHHSPAPAHLTRRRWPR